METDNTRGKGSSNGARGVDGARNVQLGSAKGLSSFALKIIALVGMTCNHAAYLFAGRLPFVPECCLFAAGGVTFPIMAFLLVEGYAHTSNVKRYAGRLFAFALISQIPYSLFLDSNGNVLFTLLIGLGLLYADDHTDSRVGFWLLAGAGCCLSLLCDWGFLGVVMILMFKRIEGDTRRLAAIGIAVASIGLPAASDLAAEGLAGLPALLYPVVGCTAAIPLAKSYNGTRGKPLKWLFYAYYPAHIAILGMLATL